jgi:hypothetical protein
MPMEHDFASDPDADDIEEVRTNIERYLNNHTREGGHAWQMNMAARPQSWHPLETSPEHPAETGAEG